MQDYVVFLTQKCLIVKKCASQIYWEITNGNKQFLKTKTCSSNLYFKGWRYIFALRITWIYAYSPFKFEFECLDWDWENDRYHWRTQKKLRPGIKDANCRCHVFVINMLHASVENRKELITCHKHKPDFINISNCFVCKRSHAKRGYILPASSHKSE